MSKAQTDIRATSYDTRTANSVGYTGTIEDVLAQIRAEANVIPERNGRSELEFFLGVSKAKSELSGIQKPAAHLPSVYVFPMNEDEDWNVEYYDAPVAVAATVYQRDLASLSPYSLEYAQRRWPQNFEVKS